MLQGEPKVKAMSSSSKDYTCVTFEPDFEKFGMSDGLDADHVDLMVKRVYDMAGCTHSSVAIYLNGEKLKIRY